MATVNKRTKKVYNTAINGIDAGGAMSCNLQYGYDGILQGAPDGLSVPIYDREAQFCRGTIITQDWVHIVELLTGTVGTLVFHERNSGVAEATGYTKHTITNPVVYRVRLTIASGAGNKTYAVATADFECKAADETKGFADMWVPLAGQAAPAYMSSARGGYRILTAAHGAQAIYHATRFELTIAAALTKASNDGDVGYTAVDVEADNMTATGSLSFQDQTVAASKVLGQTLLGAARGSLVLNVRQGQGAAVQVLTLAGVEFESGGHAADGQQDFNAETLQFHCGNSATTPLTLAGANKLLTVAAAA